MSGFNQNPLALDLALQAVELEPSNTFYINTLGRALFRNHKFEEAIDVLSRNLEHQLPHFQPFDLCALAMAHRELGNLGESSACLQWCDRERSVSSESRLSISDLKELTMLRNEAGQAKEANEND